LLRRIIIT